MSLTSKFANMTLVSLMGFFTSRNSKEKEIACLGQATKNVVGIDPVEIMDSVDDIDAEDAGNPQHVVEYVNDIYSYLRYVLNNKSFSS